MTRQSAVPACLCPDSVNSTLVSAIFCAPSTTNQTEPLADRCFELDPTAQLLCRATLDSNASCRTQLAGVLCPTSPRTGRRPAQPRDPGGEPGRGRRPAPPPPPARLTSSRGAGRPRRAWLLIRRAGRVTLPPFHRHPGWTAGSSRATRDGSDVRPGNFATGDPAMAQTAQARRFEQVENEAQRIFTLQRAAYLRHPYPRLEERRASLDEARAHPGRQRRRHRRRDQPRLRPPLARKSPRCSSSSAASTASATRAASSRSG